MNFVDWRELTTVQMIKNSLVLVLAMFVMVGLSGLCYANDLIYASSHTYTDKNQPPRYWQIGVSSKPPPKEVRPEYAEGKPDGLLTGWAGETGSLIVGFSCDQGLKNVDGPDLSVWHFGYGGTRVYASSQKSDPTTWKLLGDLPATQGHAVEKTDFEFGELTNVFYVKIEKWASGWGKGRFIDAVAGVALR
jgi:hypothetical protein